MGAMSETREGCASLAMKRVWFQALESVEPLTMAVASRLNELECQSGLPKTTLATTTTTTTTDAFIVIQAKEL